MGKPPNHPFFSGFSIINHPCWGPTPIFGNIHIGGILPTFIDGLHLSGMDLYGQLVGLNIPGTVFYGCYIKTKMESLIVDDDQF